MLFSGINHQGWEVPDTQQNLRTRTGTKCFPATLNSNCWNHLEFIPETGLLSTLSKRESIGNLSLKACLLIWAGFLCYIFMILSITRRCWLQSLLCSHQASEDHAAGIRLSAFPCLFPICPLVCLVTLPGQTCQTDLCFLPYMYPRQ